MSVPSAITGSVQAMKPAIGMNRAASLPGMVSAFERSVETVRLRGLDAPYETVRHPSVKRSKG
jgi:hypothetical protein